VKLRPGASACAFAALAAVAGCAPSPGTGFDSPGALRSETSHSAGAPYARYRMATARWLDTMQRSDGAILYSATEIEPYFANVAATGLTTEPQQLGRVRAWMAWYVAHLNRPDRWGLDGTIYDYAYRNGHETSLRRADSVDSYAATFFTLARTLYDTGDVTSQRYVVAIRPDLETMATMVTGSAISQRDGMTIALPTYPVAYLMDNAEVWRGLNDLSVLEGVAFHDAAGAARYRAAARHVADGIETLWNASSNIYASSKQEPDGPLTSSRWSVWYPDATAQLFPMLQGLQTPRSRRAAALWSAFNAAWPNWDVLKNPTAQPWVLVGMTASIEGDTRRAQTFTAAIERVYGARGYPWPWYDLEAGWYMRVLDRLGAASQVR
jgi:hypothetical protein